MNIRYARAEAEKLVKRFGFDIDSLPINVKEIAKSLDLKVREEELDEGVSGLLVLRKVPNEKVHIFVNKRDSQVRKRFTISHEIGHFVLGHEFENAGVHVDRGIHAIPRRTKLSKVEPIEVEANQFAASLLMPVEILEAAIDDLGLPLFDYDITSLAKRFDVSEQAMTIRLTTVGVL
ncbi:MAG: ImmA/IrrE family metallo-endopeptidase [Pyrinomonadaceae bacterium]